MNFKKSFKTQINSLLIFTTLALAASSCKKNNLDETTLDGPQTGMVQDSSSLPVDVKSEMLAATGVTSSSHYLVNSLPSGYVKDGSKDYTSYVQAAVTKYSNIVFPAFPILVNDNGINIGSNKVITFPSGSQLRLKSSSKANYSILRISNASNVILYNPVIVGDRYNHSGTSGEWGMGIGLYAASNVTIYSPKVTNCWGDGIYIGQLNSSNSKNIIIKDAYLSKNRRDGISIISVDGLLLDNIYAGYSDGTLPKTGINIETNNKDCVVRNVRINNPRTENNGAMGIMINLRTMLSGTSKSSEVTITNHYDTGSPRYALKVSTQSDSYPGKLSGYVNVINPSWQKTSLETGAPIWLGANHANYKINISSPEWMTTRGSMLSYIDTYNLLMQYRSGTNLKVTNDNIETTSTSTISTSTSTNSGSVVFAVNAGGSSFKASNGITYSSDKNYSSGNIYKVSTSISNTSDDVLYQSERYGSFSYNVPLGDGTYEITFRTSENYHKASAKRKFDVTAEGKEIVSNLDIYSVSGFARAYNIVKTVTVTDGILNLKFNRELDHAKIAAFHIIKK